ncbi:MAG: alpha/beta fold hydrolase [Myxococcales bacterium]|nr:MAG: alpha/beta fold hydrolase [Myxococcales bacterium]
MADILCNVLIAYLTVMAVFNGVTMFAAFLLARWRFADNSFRTDAVAAYPAGAFTAFWKEFLLTAWLYLTWPLGLSRYGVPSNRGRTDVLPPVLFVHGWTENRRYWTWLLRRLRDRPERKLYTINLHPIDAAIDHYREQLARRIDEILAETRHGRLTLVAHSLGGLVARAYMKEHGREKIERLVTFGAPHYGTVLAYGALGRVPRQVEPNSPFLTALAQGEDLSGVDLHTVATVHDNIVVPFTHAWLPGSTQHLLWGMGHTTAYWSGGALRILQTVLYPTDGGTTPAAPTAPEA